MQNEGFWQYLKWLGASEFENPLKHRGTLKKKKFRHYYYAKWRFLTILKMIDFFQNFLNIVKYSNSDVIKLLADSGYSILYV